MNKTDQRAAERLLTHAVNAARRALAMATPGTYIFVTERNTDDFQVAVCAAAILVQDRVA